MSRLARATAAVLGCRDMIERGEWLPAVRLFGEARFWMGAALDSNAGDPAYRAIETKVDELAVSLNELIARGMK